MDQHHGSNPTWQETARLAQARRDGSIAAVEPAVPAVPEEPPWNVSALPRALLPAAQVAVTEAAPEELVAGLAAGRLRSVAVTGAFLGRAGVAQRLANCVTELLPAAALARARELDDHLAAHGTPVGPLHGLPVSVKEHIAIAGLGLNAGFVAWWHRRAAADAAIVTLLRRAGAVLYARTTEPQTLMHLETSSNLYGDTVCPFNRRLTAGGSSGGEGALLGLRGSCLGVGADIGGSIRSPAANNGVYGLRPTSGRLPLGGLAATMLGQEQIVPVVGPLSTSLGGIKMFMKALLDQKPWLADPSLVPLPWRDDRDWLAKGGHGHGHGHGARRLKIGVLWDDGVVKPHPPVTRALREVCDQLRGRPGFELVDWLPYRHDHAWDILSALYFPDGGAEETAAIDASGEPWRPLSRFIIKEQPGRKALTVPEVWAWTRKRDDYRVRYLERWNATAAVDGDPDTAVDVILCPAGPGAAPPLNHARYWGYTAQWNLLDYPALVFPVTKVDPDQDGALADYEPMNDQDAWNHRLCGLTPFPNNKKIKI